MLRLYSSRAVIVMMAVLVLGLAVGQSGEAVARDNAAASILFVGNSHLLMPGFMKRVRQRLSAKLPGDRAPKIQVIAKIGTTLTKSRKRAETRAALRSQQWDVVVLQESTTAFMTGHGRRNFASAVSWFRKQAPNAQLVLWQAWPQGASHALYHRRGVWGRWFKNPPKNPKQLFSWIERGVDGAAKKHAAFISPIGRCWMRLAPAKRPYAGDDYHPSSRGLSFIAEVLSRSLVAAAAANGGQTRILGKCP